MAAVAWTTLHLLGEPINVSVEHMDLLLSNKRLKLANQTVSASQFLT